MEDTHTAPSNHYSGKFSSARDEVVYRATLDGTCDTVGDVDVYGFHASLLEDFYGFDYIVIEDSQGFVTVERFDDIGISGEIGAGYFSPSLKRWDELRDAVTDADTDSDEDSAREIIETRVGREDGAAWPGAAWPGAYPIAYVTDDGESLCAVCMNTGTDVVHFSGDADGWRVDCVQAFGADADCPDTDERCAHCNRVICEGMGADDADSDSDSDAAPNPDEYNGWVNRETWATALHLGNDHGLYLTALELCADGPNMGADRLREFVTDAFETVTHPMPDDGPAPEWARLMISDVGSLWRVDWRAVAESFIED